MSSTDMTSNTPSCFSWHDKLDPSCRKCAVKEACVRQQADTRPDCFAELYDHDNPECIACLDNSQCAEEYNKMAAPKIRIKRPAAAAATAPATAAPVAEPEEEEVVATVDATEQEEVVETAEAEEESGPYDELSVDDLRKELQERGLDIAGKRSQLVSRLEQDDIASAAKAAKKPATPTKTVTVPTTSAKPATPAVPAKAAKPAPVAPPSRPAPIQNKAEEDVELVKATLGDVFALLSEGQSLIMTKQGDSYVMSLSDGIVTTGASKAASASEAKATKSTGLRGEAYWKETLSPEYWTWYYEDAGDGKPWGNMTIEEKFALADKLGIDNSTYAHADERMATMRMTEKVQEKLGIEKWKPQYATKAAREALK